MQKEVQDLEFLRSRFDYDEESGKLTWKKRTDTPEWWNTRYAGKEPSNRDKLGYIRAKITRGDFCGYVSAHRICFFLANEYLPEVVDHIDGNVANNKASNLRPATWETNTWNRIPNQSTRTGCKGVNAVRDRNKKITGYVSRIGHGGDREYLGYFPTPDLAREAYNKREMELRKEWVRKNG